MTKLGALFFVFLTVFSTVYGQIVLKWQIGSDEPAPATLPQKLDFLLRLLANPWILSCFAAGAIAAFSWMLALSRLPLGQAYPAIALTFPLVLFLEHFLFGVALPPSRILGVALIFIGVALAVRPA